MPTANLDRMSRELIEQGKLIEAGFCLRILAVHGAAPPERLDELRNAFFAGAHYLFTAVVAVMDPSTPELTAADLRRMEELEAELLAFIKDFSTRHLPTQGSA